MLIQCSYSAWTVLIQFSRFISFLRVLVHAKIFSLRTTEPSVYKKSSAVRTAEPYPFTKKLHPYDSRSRYPAVNGLCVHKPLCSSLQTAYPLISLSALRRHKQINHSGYVNAVVFLDVKKAFDTVSHPILLSKLYSYGVKGNAYELLSSYLDNRTQKCAVNGVLSKSCTLTCEIPQGKTLGPLLFLLYINDLPNCLSNSQPRMYADDTHLTYASLRSRREWVPARTLVPNASAKSRAGREKNGEESS